MQITLQSLARVSNSRIDVVDDFWGLVISEITLEEYVPDEVFEGITSFSHLEVIFYLDKIADDKTVFSGRPRGNPAYPVMGIFGQRKKDRPNKIGLVTVELLEHNGRTIKVRGLDALNGTPVLDIKPVFREFQPVGQIRQPEWVEDLMRDYWKG